MLYFILARLFHFGLVMLSCPHLCCVLRKKVIMTCANKSEWMCELNVILNMEVL